jgi:hypothetical protein
MRMVQIHFTFSAPFAVVVSRVDPTSKQESQVGSYESGVITESACPGQNGTSQRWATQAPFRRM